MKKIIYVIFGLSLGLSITSCGGSYYIVNSAGELNMISTRNIDSKTEYQRLKTYAGIDRSQVDNAILKSKGGKIKKKNPIYKEITTYKADNLKESVDAVVKGVGGGEYLQNAKVYSVIEYVKTPGSKTLVPKYYYMTSGDVWGTNTGDENIKGFHKGDRVIFTYSKESKKYIGKVFEGEMNQQYTGKITELKSASAVIFLESGQVIELPYVLLNIVE
ncbi:MAG: hypothetical protein RL207_874 [Bacteroidota bacterium]|jgi:hypothetical protein